MVFVRHHVLDEGIGPSRPREIRNNYQRARGNKLCAGLGYDAVNARGTEQFQPEITKVVNGQQGIRWIQMLKNRSDSFQIGFFRLANYHARAPKGSMSIVATANYTKAGSPLV